MIMMMLFCSIVITDADDDMLIFGEKQNESDWVNKKGTLLTKNHTHCKFGHSISISFLVFFFFWTKKNGAYFFHLDFFKIFFIFAVSEKTTQNIGHIRNTTKVELNIQMEKFKIYFSEKCVLCSVRVRCLSTHRRRLPAAR